MLAAVTDSNSAFVLQPAAASFLVETSCFNVNSVQIITPFDVDVHCLFDLIQSQSC